MMKVSYDKAVDAAYIRFTSKKPQGAIEIEEDVILHVTDRDEIVALEILDASKHLPIRHLFSLEGWRGQTMKQSRRYLMKIFCP